MKNLQVILEKEELTSKTVKESKAKVLKKMSFPATKKERKTF